MFHYFSVMLSGIIAARYGFPNHFIMTCVSRALRGKRHLSVHLILIHEGR